MRRIYDQRDFFNPYLENLSDIEVKPTIDDVINRALEVNQDRDLFYDFLKQNGRVVYMYYLDGGMYNHVVYLLVDNWRGFYIDLYSSAVEFHLHSNWATEMGIQITHMQYFNDFADGYMSELETYIHDHNVTPWDYEPKAADSYFNWFGTYFVEKDEVEEYARKDYPEYFSKKLKFVPEFNPEMDIGDQAEDMIKKSIRREINRQNILAQGQEEIWPVGQFDSQYIWNVGHLCPQFLKIDRNLTTWVVDAIGPGLLICRIDDACLDAEYLRSILTMPSTVEQNVVIIPDWLAFGREDYPSLSFSRTKKLGLSYYNTVVDIIWAHKSHLDNVWFIDDELNKILPEGLAVGNRIPREYRNNGFSSIIEVANEDGNGIRMDREVFNANLKTVISYAYAAASFVGLVAINIPPVPKATPNGMYI